jgi:NADH:ubiquinone oxidoreductase subunit 2 (subunit N)
MFFISSFFFVFLFFFIICFISFFSFAFNTRSYYFLSISVIFFQLFIFVQCLFNFPVNFNSIGGDIFHVFPNTFLFTSFFIFFSICFSIFYFFGQNNYISTQNYISFFFYYTAFFAGSILPSVNDFLAFIIFSEILSISAYLLIFLNNTTKHFLNSFKYLVVNSISTLFLFLAFTFATFYFGVSEFSNLFLIFQSAPEWNDSFQAGYVLFNLFFFSAFVIKFGLIPFQYWVIPLYQNSSKLSVAYFSTLLKFPFFNILFESGFFLDKSGQFILVLIGFLSVLYGTCFAFYSFKTKRLQFSFRSLMGYSSIVNFGTIFISFPFFSNLAIFYAISYTAATLLIFFTYFDLSESKTSIEISSFYASDYYNSTITPRYTQSYRISYYLFILSIFFISGLPIFGLFFAKFSIFSLFFTFNFPGYFLIFAIIFLGLNFIFTYLYYQFALYSFFSYPNNYSANFFVLKTFETYTFLDYIRLLGFFYLNLSIILIIFIFYFYIILNFTVMIYATPFLQIQNYRFNSVFFNKIVFDYFYPKSGILIKIRMYNYGREYKQKGLCLSFRSRYKFTGTVFFRSRPFSLDFSFPFYNPFIKFYLPGGDGIRTHGYLRNNNLASCHFKPLSHPLS